MEQLALAQWFADQLSTSSIKSITWQISLSNEKQISLSQLGEHLGLEYFEKCANGDFVSAVFDLSEPDSLEKALAMVSG